VANEDLATMRATELTLRDLLAGVSGRLAQVGDGQRLTMAGSAQAATVPAGTTLVRLAAEGGDLRWSLSGAATGTSPGWLPEGAVEYIEATDADTLSIYGSAGAYANLLYLKRA
jgi:hypothetical protein